MLRAGEVIEETDEFQFFNSEVWYPCLLIIGGMEKGQTLLECNVGHYRRPTQREPDLWDSAPSQALSTLKANPLAEHLSTLPTSR